MIFQLTKRFTVFANVLLGAAGLVLQTPAMARASCALDTIGIATNLANASFSPFLGHAVGETFFAKDTLIAKVTVWRPNNNTSVIGAHLFITAVDTTLSPPRPTTQTILLNGPTAHVYDSTPPGQLIEMPFVIDPPLALPGPGYYAWFLQAEDCNQGEAWIIAASDTNPYPRGITWITGRAGLVCYLASVEGGQDNLDLIFRIEFCGSAVTPVQQQTWGRLKAIYR